MSKRTAIHISGLCIRETCGAECSMPIDTAVYSGGAWNIFRAATIEGYCQGISRGTVKVALNVGSCAGYKRGNAYTSWNSVSRVIVQEVDPPQY